MNDIILSKEIHDLTEKYIRDQLVEGHPFNLSGGLRNDVAHILGAALNAIICQSQSQSRWSSVQLYGTDEALASFVAAEMKKTGARCQLNIHNGEVSLEYDLPHVTELPSMNSGFWAKLSTLIDRENLKFVNDGNIKPSNESLDFNILKYRKSPLFHFLTEFHLAFQHNSEDVEICGRFSKSVVFLESGWEKIVDQFSGIFEEFAKLSQSLYRSYYIKASKDPIRRSSIADIKMVRKVYSWVLAQSASWSLTEALVEFPEATKIDVLAAHDIAQQYEMIVGKGTISNKFSPAVR